MDTNKLKKIAYNVRKDIVQMVNDAGSGHLGGSLSATEILTYLYFERMNIRPSQPDWKQRDRFILSKGHATPVYYSILGRRGYFPLEELKTFRKLYSRLQGHPDMKKTPGVDFSSGSLGQGLSVGCGMAWGIKKLGYSSRVYVLLGDGEINEGQVWEAAMSACKYKLDNVTAIIDNNGVQLDGFCCDIMPSGDIAAKFTAFGWDVVKANGHDFDSLNKAFEFNNGKPVAIIANTVKGKGVSFMENDHRWHGKPMTEQEYERAVKELD